MNEIKQILKSLGLEEKEVLLYTAALQLGESGITELARKSGLKKTTTYLIFKSLEKQGLMGSFEMKSGTKFVATRPDILISKTEKQLESIKKIIPELRAIANQASNKPKITYYEGKEGYLLAANDTLKKPNSLVRHIGSLTEMHKIIGKKYDFEYYVPMRVKKNIRFRALYTQDIMEVANKLNHPAELREIKYLPTSYNPKTTILIYDTKIAITSSQKDLFTIIIDSEDVAQAEKSKFDLIWNLID